MMKLRTVMKLFHLLFLILDTVVERWRPPCSARTTSVLMLEIAVLSARENQQRRQTIRQTWWQDVHRVPGVRARFVVGSYSCPISPPNRIDPYECREASCVEHSHGGPLWIFGPALTARRAFPGFSFLVHRNGVKLRKVGVHHIAIDRLNRAIHINILDAITRNSVLELEVSRDNLRVGDFYFRQVDSRDLNQGSTLIVMVTGGVPEHRLSLKFHEPSACLVEILRSYPGPNDPESVPFDRRRHSFYVNLEFDHSGQKESSTSAWLAKQQRIQRQLLKESTMYHDIVFVNMIDVYRELPRKWLLYLEQLPGQGQVTHVLKTDDDCFLNIRNIVALITDNLHHRAAWFGNFRQMWPVNYYGKWSERHYSGLHYPAFACGSGYVLTWDLVDWLRQNSRLLFCYQGEDVSMGIWLAALNPHKIEDDRWLCGNEEPMNLRNALSVPQIPDRETMIRIWRRINS